MSTAQTTQDHEQIKRWAESRGGVPTYVKGTSGLLRIDFVKGKGSHGHEPNLEQVEWDEWFKVFDDRELVFLYDPDNDSRFFKLVSKETAEGKQH